jgi:hypothetical protein
MVNLNPTHVIMGNDVSVPIKNGIDVVTLQSRAMDLLDDELSKARADFLAYAAPLCKKANKTELPPLRDVNHHVPIIDPSRSYSYRPSKCPLLSCLSEQRSATGTSTVVAGALQWGTIHRL